MKKFFNYFKGEKLIGVFFVLVLSSTVFSVAEPYLTGRLVEALTEQNFGKMVYVAIAIAIVATSYAVQKYGVNRISVVIRTRISKRLESDLCQRALNIKGQFLGDFKSGELTSITKQNPSEMMGKLGNIVMSGFATLASVAVACYVAFLNIWCFLLYVTFFLIIFIFQNNSLKKEKHNSDKGKNVADSGKSLVNQIFRGIADIKVLNLKDAIFGKYLGILDSEIESEKNQTKARAANRLFCNVAFEVYTLVFLGLGIWLMTTEQMSVSTFITIYLYRSYMYSLMFNVAEIRSEWQDVKVLTERINRVLAIDETKIEKFGNINGTQADEHSINFSNVSFSYGEGELLQNISLNMEQGEVIGLVGASGSAKTTLIKLLSRQLEPNSGEIKVDGQNINDYSEKGYTDIVSVASQQPFVFACSIRENMLMVKPHATESEMWKALEKAKIYGFVKSLDNGIDTIITESLNLSGGQLQRIALARLFLKNTPIIILDEATSALDNQTQKQIINVISEESNEHIFIIIAHRIEAVKNADRIIFMKNGKIADEGRHEEMLEKNPDYAKLTATLNKK